MRSERHKRGSILLLLQSICLLMVACAPLGASKHASVTAPERGVSRPETPGQLLYNLKVAFDRELVLAPEFFDDDSLLKFFGGTSIRWDTEVAPDIYTAAVAPGPLQVGATEIYVQMLKRGLSVLNSEISIQLATESDITLGQVRELFGIETRIVPPQPRMHMTSGYLPPTPLGVAYQKKVHPAGADNRPFRMIAEFSLEGNFQGLALYGPHPDRLPDQAKVISISLKVIVE